MSDWDSGCVGGWEKEEMEDVFCWCFVFPVCLDKRRGLRWVGGRERERQEDD